MMDNAILSFAFALFMSRLELYVRLLSINRKHIGEILFVNCNISISGTKVLSTCYIFVKGMLHFCYNIILLKSREKNDWPKNEAHIDLTAFFVPLCLKK